MTAERIHERIEALIADARTSCNAPGAFGFLPDIIKTLETMRANLSADRKRRSYIAGGLGRLVTEDYSFSESPLGGALLEVAEEFASY